MIITDLSIPDLFAYCDRNRIESIGFTPFGRGRYSSFIDFIKDYRGEFPQRISLFYLNSNDYTAFRNLK
jgi:diketogulonate reductase-like aldo/keto reductase